MPEVKFLEYFRKILGPLLQNMENRFPILSLMFCQILNMFQFDSIFLKIVQANDFKILFPENIYVQAAQNV